jgi:23S rRNA pseudouridine1911/1915/1917 synthase
MPRAQDLRPGGTSWTVSAGDARLRLDKFLAAPERLGSRGRVVAALDKRKVFVNDAQVGRREAGALVRAGDVVRVWIDRPGSAHRSTPRSAGDLQILYEDAVLLVVNKPAGLLAVPLERKRTAPSAFDYLEDHLRSRGKRKPLVVHRIDRDTSGVVVFAKTSRAQEQLKEQFRRREPERVYWAIVYGQPHPAAGTWRDYLVWDTDALIQKRTRPGDPRGKEAITHYRIVEALANASLLEMRLETGKRNQIRMQAQLHGHTLVGEKRYVPGSDALRPIEFPRQALHARRLSFRHPTDQRLVSFDAPLPGDFAALLTRLRRAGRRAPAGRTRSS